jgi:4-hydroxy-3-polyprenylbenzoate decarboxylase
VRLLQVLRALPGVELHLVMSAPGKKTLVAETDYTVKDVEALAHVVHDNRDIGSPIASGSFRTAGMAIAPCSIKTLAPATSRSRSGGPSSWSRARRRCTQGT